MDRERRSWISGAVGLLALGGIGVLTRLGPSLAAPAEPGTGASPDARRVAQRVELRGLFARKTRNLVARYTAERESSLLHEKLFASGSLGFEPGRLVLRDDSATGSNTRIEPGGMSIVPNDPSLPGRVELTRGEAPALAWLADHLLAVFEPGDGSALLLETRAEAPRRRSQLIIKPARDSLARSLVRSVAIDLDPVGGAVVRVEILEAEGGRFVLGISDHRQNVDEQTLAQAFE